MKALTNICLAWIVAWKVAVPHHGHLVQRQRKAAFQTKEAAEQFIRTQGPRTHATFTLTRKP